MAVIRQSFSWWCVASYAKDVPGFLKQMKALGYSGVEMIGQQDFQAVHDAGLVIASDIAHGGIDNGLNRRENHARIEDEISQKIELAVKYNIANLICFSGNRAGLSDEQGALNTADGLARVARLAEQKGVTLILELLNSKRDHVDYQCDHTAWGIMVCRMVNSPRVKLLYDIYHMQIMEGDIISTLQTAMPWIGHVHTAGNPGRHELNDQQEIFYPPIVSTLKALNYQGFLGHEFIPTGDPIAGYRQAFELCK